MTWVQLDTGQRVGKIEGDRFITHRTPDHFFRIFQSFGFALSVLRHLKERDVKEIEVNYEGEQEITYCISVAEAISKGKLYKHEDYEEQILVNIEDFKVIR